MTQNSNMTFCPVLMETGSAANIHASTLQIWERGPVTSDVESA